MYIVFNLFLQALISISLIQPAAYTPCEPASSPGEISAPTSFQGKIMRSADKGKTWESIGNGLPENLEIRAARTFEHEMFVGSKLTQLYSKRTDKSGKWLTFNVPYFDPFIPDLQNESIVDFYDTKSGVYTSITEGWLYKRPWGSGVWSAIKAPRQKLFINDILESDNGTVFLACLEGIFFSSDHGRSWSRSDFEGYAYDLDLRGGTMFVTGEWGIFTSENKGKTWRKVLTPNNELAPVKQDLDRYYHFVPSVNHMFVRRQQTSENVGQPGKFLVSYDEGKKWEVHPADAFLKDVDAVISIIVDEQGTIYCSNFKKVIRSVDNGETWETLLEYQSDDKSKGLTLHLDNGILYCSESLAGC